MNLEPIFNKAKAHESPITMMTVYDYSTALMLKNTNLDAVLVGDSVSNVIYGYDSTIYATLEMMVRHTEAVARAKMNKIIVSDLPFLSHRKGKRYLLDCAASLIRAGAHAVKLETKLGQENLVRHLVDSGIPVMGHVGLTPQFEHTLGGLRVQGKTQSESLKILKHARNLEAEGCFSVVLECVPAAVAAEVTAALTICTIGIGAGSQTDGQILVYQDATGYPSKFKPKFVRSFGDMQGHTLAAVQDYALSVRTRRFPNEQETYL